MTDEACRIYHYLKATGLTLTTGEAAHMFRMTSEQAKRAFSELKRSQQIERRADRYCAGFMVGSYGAKETK